MYICSNSKEIRSSLSDRRPMHHLAMRTPSLTRDIKATVGSHPWTIDGQRAVYQRVRRKRPMMQNGYIGCTPTTLEGTPVHVPFQGLRLPVAVGAKLQGTRVIQKNKGNCIRKEVDAVEMVL